MLALGIDTGGFYLSPSIFLALFGRAISAYSAFQAFGVIFYATIFVWILIQLLAGLALYPKESVPLFKASFIFSAALMFLVGAVATIQIFIDIEDQAPLLAGLGMYMIMLYSSSYRFSGWSSVKRATFGGLAYLFFLPTFYITFLLYSVARYDTTSWR